ncbi:MAG: symmetrical bis(5'-nucleosyl)-tetraphosphatase [Cardiobacteriaceae bacterium]|nr:symmetrical bis(5'-nucleosyl)-tetraphosphatase [Cardiobacteriaceae bacterium]
MAVYAIGDVHGQYAALLRLLERIGYGDDDALWFVGDLVNRGPDSLAVLRFVTGLKNARVVLGNHDLSLLVQAERFKGHKLKDATAEILAAEDALALLRRLREYPLLHVDKGRKVAMVHAGVHPLWTMKTAKRLNRAVGKALQGRKYRDFLRDLYGDDPSRWSETLSGMAAKRFAVNVCCRMRFLREDGALDLAAKMAPHDAGGGLKPWFDFEMHNKYRWIFGHWASCGLMVRERVACLDGGSAWGGELVAFDVDEWRVAGRVSVQKMRH